MHRLVFVFSSKFLAVRHEFKEKEEYDNMALAEIPSVGMICHIGLEV